MPRVWLNEGTGNEPGWTAWCLDLMGLATWAPSEAEVLGRIPQKVNEYRLWLERHDMEARPWDRVVSVVERRSGNEVLFGEDLEPCTAQDVDLAIRLLSASRADLLEAVHSLPAAALDWDPPYRSFAEWASWRTARQILAHVANTETHYYLPNVGYAPQLEPARPDGDWQEFLPRHRQETLRRLNELAEAEDRARITRQPEEWSARKVLRRLVRHELLHMKSIARIGREYERRHA
ncbi:MAG: DinB family protein [Armatimonadetes bacterium]|nr:DinB family protein [Armatimonadota bacterium]